MEGLVGQYILPQQLVFVICSACLRLLNIVTCVKQIKQVLALQRLWNLHLYLQDKHNINLPSGAHCKCNVA